MSEPRSTGYLKKQREYAEYYTVDKKTIQRWMAKGYPLDDPLAMQSKVAEQKKAPAAFTAFTAVDSADAKKRKVELECQRLEMQIAIQRGEHTPNTQIRSDIITIGTALRAELLRMENDLPGVLVGLESSEMQVRIREFINSIMAKWSDATSALYQPKADPAE